MSPVPIFLTARAPARVTVESALVVLAVAAFVGFGGAAAAAYPGGTHFDHASVGHDFWRNTLCDLARTVALDGTPNARACVLARVAMVSLAVGLGATFLAVPRLFPERAPLGTAVRVLGVLTVPLAIAVVLLPTDRSGRSHGYAILLAGTTGLTAASLALAGLRSASPRAPRLALVIGLVAAAVAGADFALYAAELLRDTPAQIAVAVLERVASVLLIVWMLVVVRGVHQAEAVRVQTRARRTVQRAAQSGETARDLAALVARHSRCTDDAHATQSCLLRRHRAGHGASPHQPRR